MKSRNVKPWPELREEIRQHLTDNGKKLHSLTTGSGLSWGTISTAFDPTTNDVKLGTLTAILKAVSRQLTMAKMTTGKPAKKKSET